MLHARLIDPGAIETDLFGNGYAMIPGVLSVEECKSVRAMFDCDDLFRSRVVMEKHGFGKGEYRYFAYPLPEPVASLRSEYYALLAPIANEWNHRLGGPERYPESQRDVAQLCADGSQSRPTALVLRYRTGDYNCLHEDVYGEIAFPLQMTVFLSSRDEYDGGEFVLVEQRPRRQSRPVVLQPDIGYAVVIPNRNRPVEGGNGYYRTAFRHGVSEIRSGERYALGIIFHDGR